MLKSGVHHVKNRAFQDLKYLPVKVMGMPNKGKIYKRTIIRLQNYVKGESHRDLILRWLTNEVNKDEKKT